MSRKLKVGSDFSGVGAFDQSLRRLNIEHETVFACDMDKFARQTFILNYGEPKYYPNNVYDREIPYESLDIYMTSPPCQAFSLAGNRKGEADKRGVLFYNSHEFIQKNKPRFFIFENVKGLLSDDNGKTFQRWIDFLGGKTVNGNPVIFPHEDSAPYHVYYQVLNAKHYGIPQNRERIFIIGIRDDVDNYFSFPKPFPLVKRLKDVLEPEVDEKYFLSDKMIAGFLSKKPEFAKQFKPHEIYEAYSDCLTSRYAKMAITDAYIKTGYINQDTQASVVFSPEGTSPALNAGTHGYANGYVETNHFLNPDGIGKSLRCSTGRSLTKKHSYDMITVPTVQKDNSVVYKDAKQINPSTESGGKQPFQHNRIYDGGIVGTLDTECGRPSYVTEQRIRRLIPLECFRLMDFNPVFKWDVSDSQAYKQAGNSICVGVLAAIIERLKL